VVFDRFGAELGMEKHSGSWYSPKQEVRTVLNLQKSQYGPRYYFNVGFYLDVMPDVRYPKEEDCQIRVRLDSLFPDLREDLNALLDLGTDIDDAHRTSRLTDILISRLRPLLEDASTLNGLRALNAKGVFRWAGIRPPATTLLQEQRPPSPGSKD
jgi:hypothetical protein